MKDKRVLIVGSGVLMIVVLFWLRPRPPANPEPLTDATKPSPVEVSQKTYDSPRFREWIVLSSEHHPAETQMDNWEANFPYKLTYHPTLRFDRSMYNPADESTWDHSSRRRFKTVMENHFHLKSFFENDARFSKGFEELYHILKEHDRHDNPLVAGEIFQYMAEYHHARQYDPEAVMTENGKPVKIMGPMGRDGPSFTMTWGEWSHEMAESIVYDLYAPREWPDKEAMPEEEAMALRDRILTEIAPKDVPSDPSLGILSYGIEDPMITGDPILVPNEGWVEAYWAWQDKVRPIIDDRIHQGPSWEDILEVLPDTTRQRMTEAIPEATREQQLEWVKANVKVVPAPIDLSSPPPAPVSETTPGSLPEDWPPDWPPQARNWPDE